jgi:hypothetical protein
MEYQLQASRNQARAAPCLGTGQGSSKPVLREWDLELEIKPQLSHWEDFLNPSMLQFPHLKHLTFNNNF